ncbi:ABC transporter ATP-binding protein [Paracandidimonas soli]|uniref:Spermidine/putrescine transport system ATP-binding protein n=1 Tax=Paracandidimonas soli TaxID=1917182 RepID=A0A4R3VGM0_9BURK|nr:ABC transporter ATP-binding protein [Paracandidimonas soli]TCV02962.1 spermidine/putrescine transport system ATP-binding protein [Paracandidimonas soli]
MAALLTVDHLSKSYNKKVQVLSDVSLSVDQGEFIALLGPSGCGKTTLLATLAGFIAPDQGRLLIEGQDITALPPHRRPLNTVFQNYALFPHMTVLANVSYGPLRAGSRRSEARERALRALEMVGLESLAERYPADMSGGQRQRVALARAIVNRPKLLLLDEPLSALDMKLRKHMQRELKALQEKLGISFIFVTHDQEEAMAMADRIVVMNQGRIEQIGTGDEIYQRPASRFVANFIGDANLLACEAVQGELRLACCGTALKPLHAGDSTSVMAMLRPEDIGLSRQPGTGHPAQVESIVNIGSYTTYYLSLNDTPIEVRRIGANDLGLLKGDTAHLDFPVQKVHFVEA